MILNDREGKAPPVFISAHNVRTKSAEPTGNLTISEHCALILKIADESFYCGITE